MPTPTISVFKPAELLAAAPPAKPVALPQGNPIAHVTTLSRASATGNSRHGVWQCTPGVWRRQILQAEFCHFLAGEAIFTPDDGEPARLAAGDVAFFPANSAGVWEILVESRKIFVVFDDAAAA